MTFTYIQSSFSTSPGNSHRHLLLSSAKLSYKKKREGILFHHFRMNRKNRTSMSYKSCLNYFYRFSVFPSHFLGAISRQGCIASGIQMAAPLPPASRLRTLTIALIICIMNIIWTHCIRCLFEVVYKPVRFALVALQKEMPYVSIEVLWALMLVSMDCMFFSY